MSSNTTQSSEEISNQRFIDKQMAGVIETIVTHTYSLANKGFIPSEKLIADYVDSLDEQMLLQMIRKHPGAASTRALTASDEDLLRWARMVGRPAT